jgi:hypothetical protein
MVARLPWSTPKTEFPAPTPPQALSCWASALESADRIVHNASTSQLFENAAGTQESFARPVDVANGLESILK